jgi:hypothetical protein
MDQDPQSVGREPGGEPEASAVQPVSAITVKDLGIKEWKKILRQLDPSSDTKVSFSTMDELFPGWRSDIESTVHREGHLPVATDISPIGLFEKVKLDLRDLGNIPLHPEYRHYRPCGLKRLATKIINPKGNDRLARWIMRTGGKAIFATEGHFEYMKARRKKYKQLSFDWACAIAD